MAKYFYSILFVSAVAVIISLSTAYPQSQNLLDKRLGNVQQKSTDDLEDGSNRDDLKTSASHGYGYYGYPLSGLYGGYPYIGSYGLQGGYYGGYNPFYGGYGFHGHYF